MEFERLDRLENLTPSEPAQESRTPVAPEEDLLLPSLNYKRAVRLLKQNRFDEAYNILKTLIRTENGFEVLEALSICLYHLGQWSECAHVARQALMLGEGFRDQRFQLQKFLGNCLTQLRDLEGAREAYEKAFLLCPGSDVLQVNFGTLAIQENEWDQAIACFRQALFLNCDNDRAWVGLALCHRHMGDLELAFANAARALDQDPMNETALALLLDWCREPADYKQARVRFFDFTDAGGFSTAVSKLFIIKAHQFGDAELSNWEQFHLRVRAGKGHG